MKNEKLFNETIDKLVKAYFDGTLEHGNCRACAAGNICGDSLWAFWFFTTIAFGREDEYLREGRGYRQIKQGEFNQPFPKKYPYSLQELMDIEWAFETAPKEGDWEFNGLMAVVDVLEKIHECDTETTKATKQRFHKNRNFSQSFCQ